LSYVRLAAGLPAAPLSRAFAAAALTLSFAGAAQASCGSAFCSINTDWTSEAVGLAEGRVLDLRYERIRQDQPRSGTRRIAVGAIPHHHDEVSTTNQNLLVNYSQNFASGWGYALVLPLVDREHLHIHNHGGGQIPEQWSVREVGDLRVTGRYQLPLGTQDHGARTGGVVFGLKLPTGRTGVGNEAGDVAERSLQPGSGTTDAILGGFLHQQLPDAVSSWFAQAQYQVAVRQHEGFAPGGQLTADLGYARRMNDQFALLLQLNAVAKQRDRGDNAEPADSGSRSLFLSPGISWGLGETMRVYAFFQQPLYQRVNGVQLTARHAITVGLATRF
jgi:hypothetical protein